MAEAADFDPPYAPERECFGSFTHQEIWDGIHEVLDPGALDTAAGHWRANADAVAAAFAKFADTTRREFGQWSGHTANAARRTTRDFIRLGTETHDVCRAVEQIMADNSEAARTLRAALPAPRPYRPLDDPAAEAVHGGRRRMDHDMAAAAATADAQDAMATRYLPTLPASGDRVPGFPTTATDAERGDRRW